MVFMPWYGMPVVFKEEELMKVRARQPEWQLAELEGHNVNLFAKSHLNNE
jgi:hypothetical protein